MGYKSLVSKRIKKFLFSNILKGNNLIRSQENKYFKANGITKLKLEAVKFNNWRQKLKWEQIQCKEYSYWIKATPCQIGKNKKIFVKYLSNDTVAGFGTYLFQLFSGEITLQKHLQFIKLLKKTMKNDLIYIHNTDVEWFHIKTKN